MRSHTVVEDVGIIALHQASASSEHARILSTRPRRNRRIDALSYVETRRPWTLKATQSAAYMLSTRALAAKDKVDISRLNKSLNVKSI